MGELVNEGVRSAGRKVWRRWLSVLLSLSFGAVLLVALPAPPVSAAVCDAPVVNEVACENSRPGNPASEWDVSGSGSASLQGFATDISVNRGSSIGFKVKTALTSYRLDIYRMGYYGGLGARKITTVNVSSRTTQPACKTFSTGLVDCGNWTQTSSWSVPSTAVSGVYFAHLVGGSAESHIFFIVRDDASTSDLLFQTSDTTWQAYNSYGDTSSNKNSLYVGSPAGRAYKVSYNRPFVTRAADTEHDWVFNAEYPAIRFLEANGYDVSYTTGVDSDRRGNLIKNHKTFLSVGHDEYWSGGQRANVEAARDAGVNLAFMSGNEVFWKTRWEGSAAGTATPYRTLVTYKETADNAKTDPIGSAVWTGTWRDPRFSPPADGGRPENALTGTMFTVNCCTTDMTVDGVDGQMRFWRNTRVASLAPSQRTTLGSGILGYEWDESPDNGYRPAGAISVSTTSENVSSYLQDYGWSYAPGSATHHLTLYRAPSGALVFGAGSVQWAWGLDDNHAIQTGTADSAVQQATVNLLADMGAQPKTLQAGLVAASPSTDKTAPTSAITAPAAGATVPVGSPVTVSGTATDAGGGKVGGVEVSTDNGISWHPASGRGSWTYTFTPGSNGSLTIKTRASDDSLNLEVPGAGRTLTVGSGGSSGGACPCTIFAPTATPAVASDPDTTGTEVGVKFRSSQAGYVTGLRFYKGTGNSGTHVGSLWSAAGSRLGTATFANESASGWQQVSFATPVPVAAGTTYVASYYAANGHYSTTDGFFGSPSTSGPLTALQDNADGPNGVYRTGSSGFPNLGYAASNYWVDIVFTTSSSSTDTTKPTVTARTPAAAATDVGLDAAVTATFSEPVVATSPKFAVSSGGAAVAGTVSYDAAAQRATFTPDAPLAASTTYTVLLSEAKDNAGNTMEPVSWSFTTAASDTTPPTITSRAPAAGATGVATSTSVSATFSETLQPGSAMIALSGPSGTVAGNLTYDATSRTARLTPSAALAASTTYTATVSGAKDSANNTMATVTWTFTTAAPSSSGCPCTIWAPTAVPATASDPDTAAVEIGVKFRASQSGSITGIRFYKGAQNTGTHVGTLWSRTGTKLASVTFAGESSTGWQQASFSGPVPVTAGTTYVASYFAPVGGYAVNEGYFATAATSTGPLTALRDGTDGANGVYRYGGSSGFPTSSYKSSNYWVDVVFTTS